MPWSRPSRVGVVFTRSMALIGDSLGSPTQPLSRAPRQALGFDLQASSFSAFLPWLVMAFGSPASGLLADHLVARGVPVVTVRKALQVLRARGTTNYTRFTP